MVRARWSRLGRGRRELGGATRDVVDVVRGRREIGGAARDVVDMVRGRHELGRLA